MAEALKRENDIITLKIELAGRGQANCMLQFLVDGRLQSLPQWEGSLREFGLDDNPRNPRPFVDESQFRLPDGLVHSLNSWLHAFTDGSRPLWVHLVKPYGGLRYLPWERLLLDALGVPVLMLPDFIFPPPRESASTLDIAICASAPLDCERGWVRDGLHEAIIAIRNGLGDRGRLHLFADTDMFEYLRDDHPASGTLLWHPQQDAEPFVAEDISSRLHDSSGTLRSPWLLWMRERLKPYSTDVVHFVCHGHLSRDRGAMLFAQSPLERTESFLAGPVGSIELSNFLTQVGAWATAFSSPFDNHNPVGLRTLADEIAQSLPGPMLLFNRAHPSLGSDNLEDLAQGYRFVFSTEPQQPPRSRSLFLYCQPYLLSPNRGQEGRVEQCEEIASNAMLYTRNELQHRSALSAIGIRPEMAGNAPPETSQGRKTVSAVTAATERLAEQLLLEQQQLVRDGIVTAEVAERDMQVASETMTDLRAAIQDIERRRVRDDVASTLREIAPLLDATEGIVPPPADIEVGIDDQPQQEIEDRLQRLDQYRQQYRHLQGDPVDIDMMIGGAIDSHVVQGREDPA